MRKLLQIGEVAQLLGVTAKTIRHYHKVGLLSEADRTEGGYRLYNAQDLLRLKQIRHMQTFGLTLRQIKMILGDASHEHTLRQILQALDTELADQMRVLGERRGRIQAILSEERVAKIDRPVTSASFEIIKDLLGERLKTVSPSLIEMEKTFWQIFDGFDWPVDYRETLLKAEHDFVTQKPQLLESLLVFNEKLAMLATVAENAPEVDAVIEEYKNSEDIQAIIMAFNQAYSDGQRLEGPFAEILKSMVLTNISPAQHRFFVEIECWNALVGSVDQPKGMLNAKKSQNV